jgi:thiol-disulfide isomerase/thioredoxin
MRLFSIVKIGSIVFISVVVALFEACESRGPDQDIVPLSGIDFSPGTFKPDFDWKGKTVVLELFTGSECPPCLGVGLAVEGLLESYDKKYLAILEYHVNIPAPDPMENRYSHLRRFDYGVYRAPMTFFDGSEKFRGGGNDTTAYRYFQQYAQEINMLLEEEPVLEISAASALSNDNLIVTGVTVSDKPEHTRFTIALVEKEVAFQGINRIQNHTMVVRRLENIEPDETGHFRHEFDLSAIEAQNEKWLTTLEANFAPFTFREKKHLMNADNLQIVIFAQDTLSMTIHNAYVGDVVR